MRTRYRATQRARLRPRSISLRIEALTFSGFGRSQSIRIADAMQHELAASLSDRGVPSTWTAAARPPAITIRPGMSARDIGRLVAHALMDMRIPR